MPSESAITPSIVTSGWSSDMTRLFIFSSSGVTVQSWLESKKLMIVAPVDPLVQPQPGGIVGALQSRMIVMLSWGGIAGMTLLSMSSLLIAPAKIAPPDVPEPIAVSEMPDALTRAPIRSSWIGALPPSEIWSESLPGPPVNVPPTILPASAAFVGLFAATAVEAVPVRW